MENKINILFTNVGRRATLLKDFKKSLGESINIIATDNWSVAPALFVADKYYLTPKITDSKYIESVFDICKKENINVITTCVDTEIELLASYKEWFDEMNILTLLPSKETASICFDKYKMFKHLENKGIKTVLTFSNLEDFDIAYKNGEIKFPVFVKPRTGSGSVGIAKINDYESLKSFLMSSKFDNIIQEYMDCEDCDADVYVDTISKEVVSIFSKKKIETRIGGASKTISFKDDKLFDFVKDINKFFDFNGPIDMDFFIKNGVYYLSEINPRFGGAYLHAFGANVDFTKYIFNNVNGIVNNQEIGSYDDDSIMLMYDEVVIVNKKDLKGDYND